MVTVGSQFASKFVILGLSFSRFDFHSGIRSENALQIMGSIGTQGTQKVTGS